MPTSASENDPTGSPAPRRRSKPRRRRELPESLDGGEAEGARPVGVIYFGDGARYKGEWSRKTGLPHGRGVLSFPPLKQAGPKVIATYQGEWRACRMHGWGEMRYANGDAYVGEFHRSLPQGRGTYTVKADGSAYEGDFREGKQHGRGTYRYAGGDVYDGDWADGVQHGWGSYAFGGSGDVMEGVFRSGVLTDGAYDHAAPLDDGFGGTHGGSYVGKFRHGHRVMGKGTSEWIYRTEQGDGRVHEKRYVI